MLQILKGITGNTAITTALWFKSTYNNTTAQQSFVNWGEILLEKDIH